jgi:hypothetical protein
MNVARAGDRVGFVRKAPTMTDRPQDDGNLDQTNAAGHQTSEDHPFKGARLCRRARKERAMRLKRGLAAVVLALGLAACVSTGVDTYEEFRSALESGASCSELIDQRDGLSGADREKATADLEEMGCVGQDQDDEDA